jgi:hypothetical protein
MVPAFLNVSSRSTRERASGTIRATLRPRSVTTIVAPIFTSRTHSLSFDLSSRMETLRSFMSLRETTFYYLWSHEFRAPATIGVARFTARAFTRPS